MTTSRSPRTSKTSQPAGAGESKPAATTTRPAASGSDRDARDPKIKRPPPQRVAVSRGGMVSTAHFQATDAGVRMLEAGGNAIDAAIAAAFALGVCEPAASGLGGQTMMMIHLAESGRTFALDGSSRAPNRATPESLSDGELLRGHRATTVPSTPACLRYALEKYGTMRLSKVLQPSIELAENGIYVSDLLHGLMGRERKHLRAHSGGAIFLQDGRRPYPAGSTLKQPALARTFRRISKYGIKSFYSGRIARQIHDDMVANDGLLRRDDLAQVPRPIERKPLSCRFRGLRVFTFPPPAAGRTLVENLNVLSHFSDEELDLDSPQGAVRVARSIQQALIDRDDRPFDPNFYPQLQNKRMVSKRHAADVAKKLGAKMPPTSGETTHLSVMDRFGNVVALTQSIERVFGSFVATPELGFLYNNYMSAFEYKTISHPYYLRPNAVPWASVAPSILLKGKKPYLAIGSPGSERITSAIVQVLLRLSSLTPLEAVDAPRLHCSLEGKLSYEAERFTPGVVRALKRRRFEMDEREPYSFYLGCVQLVYREGDVFTGVADPRRDGSARGPRARKIAASRGKRVERKSP